MLDVNEAKTGAKALYQQAAMLSGLNVSAQSPEELAMVIERKFSNTIPHSVPSRLQLC